MAEDKVQSTEDQKTGFLEEEPGQTSNMRVMTFTTVVVVLGIFLAANVLMLIKYWKGAGSLAMADFSPYAFAALMSAFAAKWGQKALENVEKIGDLVNKIKGN